MSDYHPIKAATLEWQDDLPFSTQHGDIYFSCEGGIKETQYVFIEGNQLQQRWQQQKNFTIAETGFGTGLNFLCAAKNWLDQSSNDATLHFISVEKYPLTQDDLKRAIEQWPELKQFGAELLKNYPPLTYGYHRRDLFGGRIALTLMLGDVEQMFSQLNAEIDAWFLDGFAPSKNPDMWTDKLFKDITRLTKANGTFATFTAAGAVRRALQQHGFEVEIKPGFGRKRDMLTGQLKNKPKYHPSQPWFHFQTQSKENKKAIVIGGGLAGCSAAYSLAKRNWQVTLIERHPEIAQEASGNHAGVVMPRLTADMNSDGQFYLSAFLHSISWLNRLKRETPELPWHPSGVIQLCDEKQQQRLSDLELPDSTLSIFDTQQTNIHCGIKTNSSGIFFPQAGWIEPPALCHHLIEKADNNIDVMLQHRTIKLKRSHNQWQIHDANGIVAEAPVAIIANGYDAENLLGHEDLFKLIKTRGQIAYLPATAKSKQLKTAVCYEGYVIPEYKNLHCAGATYAIDDNNSRKDEDDSEILAQLANALPGFDIQPPMSGRVAFRTSTEDHLPIIGAVPDSNFFQREYKDIHHGKPAKNYPAANYLPDLFVSVGHGSRGLVSCPFAAEIIAAMLNNEPLPIAEKTLNALHPARFFIRELKRNR